jgi:tetratricopeptide (TPR) repeat protein
VKGNVLGLFLAVLLVAGCASPTPTATPVPTATHAPQTAEEYIEVGESLAEQQKYLEAIDDFSTAIGMDSQNAEAFFLRGRAHYDYAVKMSIDETGHAPETVPFLSDAVTEQLRLAVDDFTSAVELDPQYAKAYNNRGNARSTLGDLQGGVEDYDKALELDGSLTLSYYNRGVIQYKLGNYAEAIADLEKYLELVPDAEDRTLVEDLIQQMGESSTP